MAGDARKPAQLTERQQKWFAAVRAGLERDTGRTLEQWVAIARTCPETRPRARLVWLRERYGLGQNRAATVLAEAFPSDLGWDEPERLRDALWSDPGSRRILEAVEAAVADLPGLTGGQRKGFTAFSRTVQFAALRPVKGGGAMLGVAVEPSADPRLEAPRNESWSERLKARLPLADAAEVDDGLKTLLRQAWERS
ncbi:DUF4287 domain-containing protein [Phenylobacterium sp.]|uniref:DUF4287 domain-containing protein n=1 Tax=Phenylobacterium sp. TaxID=1871053 RepID=UPI0035B23EA1